MISLIHPSRGRPEKSFINSAEWILNAGCEVELLIAVDQSDPEAVMYRKFYGATCYQFNSTNVVDATNRVATLSKGDILVYLSDDFKCFPDWGKVVSKEFEGITEPKLIKVDDCLQRFEVPVLTIPIMNRALYNKLGYFWHPAYKSMFVDEDLYWTTRQIGALKMCPHIKFEHAHVSVGKAEMDETYKRSSAHWDQGKETFKKRKALGFPI